MADYSGKDWYFLSHSWEDGQWWSGKCFDHNKWRGPLPVLLDEMSKIQKRHMKTGIWKKGKIVKDGNEWLLTFQ